MSNPLTRTQKILLMVNRDTTLSCISSNTPACHSETDVNHNDVQENSSIIEDASLTTELTNFDNEPNNILNEPSLNCNLDELPISVLNFDDDGNVTFQDLDKIEVQNSTLSITADKTKKYHSEENNYEDNDSDYGEEIETEIESESSEDKSKTETEQNRKRKKRQFVDKKKWSKNENQKRRETGREYYGKRKNNGKWDYSVHREERNIGKRCNCMASMKNKSIQCRDIEEEERNDIFRKFWSDMSWTERKIYVGLLVTKEETKRHRNRKTEERSRRDFTWFYYLKKSNEKKIRVCKKMFLNTHGLKERTVIDWKREEVMGAYSGAGENTETIQASQQTEIIEKADKKEILKMFFKELPKVESHYCRSRSLKLYLERQWDSKAALYRLYVNWCKGRNTKPASDALFSNVFEELNLSLFKPKKDECDVCVSYRSGNVPEEEYSLHVIKKTRQERQRKKTKSQ